MFRGSVVSVISVVRQGRLEVLCFNPADPSVEIDSNERRHTVGQFTIGELFLTWPGLIQGMVGSQHHRKIEVKNLVWG